MELFDRNKMNYIEGINTKDLIDIFNNSNEDKTINVNGILYDTILLSNNKTIGCVCKYYTTKSGKEIKKSKVNSACPKVQRFFNLDGCIPFDCTDCHKLMIYKKRKNEIYIKNMCI